MFSRVARRQLAARRQLLETTTKSRRGDGTGSRLFSTSVSRRADFAHVVSLMLVFGLGCEVHAVVHDGFEAEVVEVPLHRAAHRRLMPHLTTHPPRSPKTLFHTHTNTTQKLTTPPPPR